MKIEKLEISNKKVKIAFIVGFILAILLVVLVNYLTSRASYRNTQSIPLMSGTINYSVKNVNHIYVKEQESGSYKEQSNIPKGNYELNTSQSYCTKKPSTTHLSNITFNYNASLGTLNITGIPEIKAICHIYFDKKLIPSEETLAKLEELSGSNYTVKEQTTFNGTSSDTSKVIYKLEDNDGDTYVFRGNPDNWVIFAGFTWRIIRINGDGTLRLLYYCDNTTCISPAGASSSLKSYNVYYEDNTYVGYYYGTAGSSDYSQTHSNKTKSTIATELTSWYNNNLKNSYGDKLSGESGWCNDRQLGTSRGSYTGDGTGTQVTVYAPASRLTTDSWVSKTQFTPKLTCEQNDLYTISGSKKGNGVLDVPIGLITADEAAIGGLLYSSDYYERASYVSANFIYWTMSPFHSEHGNATVYGVVSPGYLGSDRVDHERSVRPVINVNLDKVTITGSGTSSNRFAIK